MVHISELESSDDRSLKARGKAPPVMMRMKSETIAEGSEPSSMGSLASSSNINDNDHAESNHVVSRTSDVVLEDIDDNSDEGNLNQVGSTSRAEYILLCSRPRNKSRKI